MCLIVNDVNNIMVYLILSIIYLAHYVLKRAVVNDRFLYFYFYFVVFLLICL